MTAEMKRRLLRNAEVANALASSLLSNMADLQRTNPDFANNAARWHTALRAMARELKAMAQ